ncbi:MAG: ketopantoate reductase family protein [Cyclobacteriaceae bacterium]|nr:ketopantoate reductase family protein [Cyclobacteriaceae bacterium]
METKQNFHPKVLVFGAGTIGSYYTYKLNEANIDVTLLARGDRYAYLKEHGVKLIDEITKTKFSSKIRVIDHIDPDEVFDFVIVLVRKNALQPIIKQLSGLKNLKNIVFMGNNVLGFDAYIMDIDKEKLFFGFPQVGGKVKDQIVYLTEKAEKGKARPITIGEMDGSITTRLKQFEDLLKQASFNVDIVNDIDGWLKYHAAFVLPLGYSLYKHNCDNYAVAKSKETQLEMVKAAKDAGNVLRALGYKKRYPFKFNLFYWLPEKMTSKVIQALFNNEYAKIAFAHHASYAIDEMEELTSDFYKLIKKSNVSTPNFDKLSAFVKDYKEYLALGI